MVKRDGFVYSLYLKNFRNLALVLILAVLLLGISIWDYISGGVGERSLAVTSSALIAAYAVVTATVLALTVLFGARPVQHPVYKQLSAYGNPEAVAESIDVLAGQLKVSGKSYDLPGWTVTRSAFVTTIRKK